MKNAETILICLILFVITGIAAYVITTVYYRSKGKMSRYEGLFDYYKKIEQREGNIVMAIWSVVWIVMMLLCAGFCLLWTYVIS